WERSAEAAARYLLLFPGALLSAVGLWRQRRELAGMPGIRPYAALAAVCLAVYAVVGGLVVEPAPWVPGGPATAAGWLEATSLPLALLRGLLGLGMLVAVIKLLEIFEVEAKQRIEALDRARAVAEERARFGRDLHDGTIQSIYACGLHLESLAMRIDEPEMREEVRTVVSSLNSTIDGLRGYINALRRPPDSPAGIAAALDALTRDFAAETGMQVRFSARGMESSGPLPEEAGQHLAQIMREALANVARHAGPCAVDAALEFRPDELGLTVTDCGRGLVADRGPAEPGHGNGMRNMHERARWLGGRLEVSPAPDGGTRVSVAIPLDFEAPDQVDVPPASEVSSR
ncbi:MAG: sensor histidine kinase, partial [Thermoleophilia bacterium]|nr:sensor histidine kinase [Thermoleophilia bacterium]